MLCYKLLDDDFLDKEGKIKEELKFNITNPTFKIQNSKFLGNPDDKFETMLFLPEGEGRKGEGGLRTKGYFKFSYKLVQGSRFKVKGSEDVHNLKHGTLNVQQPLWYLCDLNGNPIEPAPVNIQQKIFEFISQQSNTVEAVTSCSSRSASPEYRSPNIDSPLPTPDQRSHRSPVTNHLSPFTNHQSQPPSQSPITELPLITVITVVLNGAKTLEQTIESVINQTYPNVEYIIIDGGSTDGTLDIIKKYENYIDYWVSEKDEGIYDAMNKGTILASGIYIYYLGAGDMLLNSNTFYTIIATILLNTQRIRRETLIILPIKIDKKPTLSYPVCQEELPIIHHQGAIFNLSSIKILQLYDLKYKIHSDFDFILNYCKKYGFCYINIPACIFQAGGTSNSGKTLLRQLRELFIIYFKHGGAIFSKKFLSLIARPFWYYLNSLLSQR